MRQDLIGNLSSKFKNLGDKTSFLYTPAVMRKALENGLCRSTNSLLGNFEVSSQIVEMLQSLSLELLKASDITRYQTRQGFDYQAFLNNTIIRNRFSSLDYERLKDFVFIKEFNINPTQMLINYDKALKQLIEYTNRNGIDKLEYTSINLISFLTMYAARDTRFRIAHQNILLEIAASIKELYNKSLESKFKKTVRYKGITISAYGDNTEVLKEGIKKTMEVINRLPEPFLIQLSQTKGIKITDRESPLNFEYLMTLEKHYDNPNVSSFTAGASYDYATDLIEVYDVENRNVNSLTHTFYHELGHAMAGHLITPEGTDFIQNTRIWQKAQAKDNRSVTDYGDTSSSEDFAEMCEEYGKTCNNKIGMARLRMLYPNRVKVLEAVLDLRMYDSKKPNSLSDDRKLEIMGILDDEHSSVIDTFINEDERLAILNLPPKERLDIAENMINNGSMYQFIKSFMVEKFFEGLNSADIKQLFQSCGQFGIGMQTEMLFILDRCGLAESILDYDKIEEAVYRIVPQSPYDAHLLSELRNHFKYNEDYSTIFYLIHSFSTGFTKELSEQLSDIISNSFRRTL